MKNFIEDKDLKSLNSSTGKHCSHYLITNDNELIIKPSKNHIFITKFVNLLSFLFIPLSFFLFSNLEIFPGILSIIIFIVGFLATKKELNNIKTTIFSLNKNIVQINSNKNKISNINNLEIIENFSTFGDERSNRSYQINISFKNNERVNICIISDKDLAFEIAKKISTPFNLKVLFKL